MLSGPKSPRPSESLESREFFQGSLFLKLKKETKMQWETFRCIVCACLHTGPSSLTSSHFQNSSFNHLRKCNILNMRRKLPFSSKSWHGTPMRVSNTEYLTSTRTLGCFINCSCSFLTKSKVGFLACAVVVVCVAKGGHQLEGKVNWPRQVPSFSSRRREQI